MCSYYGFRRQDGSTSVTTPKQRALGSYTDECPNGVNRFEWGFYSSGTVRLAKAILQDRLKISKVADLPCDPERFACEVLQHFPASKDWTLTYEDIDGWLSRQAGRKPLAKGVPAKYQKRGAAGRT